MLHPARQSEKRKNSTHHKRCLDLCCIYSVYWFTLSIQQQDKEKARLLLFKTALCRRIHDLGKSSDVVLGGCHEGLLRKQHASTRIFHRAV
jgi:hypothetical protein